MMLIGFGFLMIFLRFHRWNTLGLTLYVSAFAMQFYLMNSVVLKKFILFTTNINSFTIINSFYDMIKS